MKILETDYPGQFALATEPFPVPEHFRSLESDGLFVAFHPRVPITRIVAEDGRPRGFILGIAVDLSAEMVLADWVEIPGSSPEAFEERLSGLAGRWVALLHDGNLRRLYLDADGTMSAVFDPGTGRAASTTGLLLDADAYDARFERALYDHLDVANMGWFPAGLTAHRGIRRLMCNHYLDLDRRAAVRHWPRGPIEICDDPAAATVALARHTIAAMRALSKDRNCIQSLTSGYESRVLLACAKSVPAPTETFIISHPDGAIDLHAAERLAPIAGVPLRRIPVEHATPEQQERWRFLTGHCVGGENVHSHISTSNLLDKDLVLIGLGGEIGRAFFWRASDTDDMDVTADLICGRMGLPHHPVVKQAVTEWLAPLKQVHGAFSLLDLGYLELRMSCWGYAHAYAPCGPLEISPMISGSNYRLMLSLPPDWKRDQRFIHRLLEREAPELTGIPFNRFGSWRDVVYWIRKLSDLPRVRTRIRKLFAG